jgi:hypothetical protein
LVNTTSLSGILKASQSTQTQAKAAITADKKASSTPVVAPSKPASVLSAAKPAATSPATSNANSILASQSNPGNAKYIPSYASSTSKTTKEVTSSNNAITQAKTVASSLKNGVYVPSYANPSGASAQRANTINSTVKPSTTTTKPTTTVAPKPTVTTSPTVKPNPAPAPQDNAQSNETVTETETTETTESDSAPVDAVPYSPYAPEVSIPMPPIKTATPDIVLFNDDAVPAEIIADLLFENIGGQELLTISRFDTVNGEDVKYQPIKNLNIIQQEFNPNNLLKLQQTSETVFGNFPIRLIGKIPNIGNGPDGSNIYRDSVTGDIVIEFVNLANDEQVDVQIATSGTIYEAGI